MARELLRHLPGVAGTDEAGRGPLAGPVVAAAVILPDGFDLSGLDDSKKLSPERRQELAVRIREGAVWAVDFAHAEEIDRRNILRASLESMRRAVAALSEPPIRVVVDGNHCPDGLPCPGEAVIQGDATLAPIAAASILAKTARDAWMVEADREYPGYGFARHFGYPTPEHLEALRKLGPTPLHRRSFAPVRALVEQGCLFDV